jgi:hypothetical protein
MKHLLNQQGVFGIIDGIVLKTALGQHFVKDEFDDGRTACAFYFDIVHGCSNLKGKFTKVFLLTFEPFVKNILNYDTEDGAWEVS